MPTTYRPDPKANRAAVIEAPGAIGYRAKFEDPGAATADGLRGAVHLLTVRVMPASPG
jgi:hypothetical protein